MSLVFSAPIQLMGALKVPGLNPCFVPTLQLAALHVPEKENLPPALKAYMATLWLERVPFLSLLPLVM